MAWSNIGFFSTGDGYYNALLDEFAHAQRSILLESYIFRFDGLGQKILDALSAARARGLEILLRLDGAGSREDLPSISRFCAERQIDLEVFHPLPFTKGSYFSRGLSKMDSIFARWRMANRRNHRKLVIIDEEIAFTGGRNVDGAESEAFWGEDAWRDLSLRLEGSSVQNLLSAFRFERPRDPLDSCLMNHYRSLRRMRNHWLTRQFLHARHRIWITTPYFAPTPRMLRALRLAADRGVDIRLLLSHQSDVKVSQLAAWGLYRKILDWKIRLLEFQPAFLHRKLMIIDSLAVVGSGNFNHRSLVHDVELDVILTEENAVNRVVDLFLEDQSRSDPIQNLQKFTFAQRVLSWCVGWFTYWL